MSIKKVPFENLKDLGDRLREIREKHNLSARKMGQRLGVTNTSVIRWESGEVEPPLAYIVFLVREFGCELEWLIFGTARDLKLPEIPADISFPSSVELILENRRLSLRVEALYEQINLMHKQMADLKDQLHDHEKRWAESVEEGEVSVESSVKNAI